MTSPAAASAVRAHPLIPGTTAKLLPLCDLSVHVLTRLFLMEGEDLLEEMLQVVGVSPASAGGGGDGSDGVPAAAVDVGREPMGPPCWHRVMLVPEEFTAALVQQQPRGAADGSLGPGGASSLNRPGGAGASLGPAGSSVELPPASPLRPPRVPEGDTSRGSFRRKSMPDATDGASPSSLRPSECDGVVPEDASSTSLPRRRASFISNGGIDSAKMLRLASGEGCEIMRSELGV